MFQVKGSYSGDLNTKLVRYSNGQIEVGYQMVHYLYHKLIIAK